MVNCSNCGFDVGESKFCPHCGNEIIIEEPKAVCPNCGKDVGESAFCPNCGTKIENESLKSFCPNCGSDVGDSKFCPNCGTKIDNEHLKSFCPSCGKSMEPTAKFCPYCGFTKSNTSKDDENGFIDNVFEFDDNLSNKFGNLLGKSKAMNSVLDKTASFSYKRKTMHVDNGMNRKYFEKIEPVFLEVCDSIDDEFVKSILIYQRSMMGSSSGIAGVVASQIYTPTKDLSHDDAIKFYQNMVNEIVAEINQEKSKGTFDEEEFYKKKIKENTINNISVLGFSKSIKTYKNNQK